MSTLSMSRHTGRTQRMLEAAVDSDAINIVVVARTAEHARELKRRLEEMVEVVSRTADSTLTVEGQRFLFRSADHWEEALFGLHPAPEVFHDHAWRGQ